uniref:Uncharacterized protein n=1 Tax=Tanacetum cinerariifolium TaxID=118510 RepID=A0A6L2LW07_TANCI|nr:hypothetical protein [Tanacetum cinerariifolium]
MEETGKGPTSESSAKKKGRTVFISSEDMQKRRNDVKARTTLLLALPDEHQLRFRKYETAKEMLEAILKTFGGNEATKKTKKNQLKLQYGNFKAKGSETLEQTFNRLLAPEWLMYTIVWRNKDDLDTMSLDDVYNHLKVYEPEVQKKSESNSQNMAFISLSNTNSGKGKVHIASVLTASTQVSTTSTDVATASLSHDTICAYIATQSNGSKEEEHAPKALMAIDGIGWDWSYMANKEENYALVVNDEVPTEFALMAKSISSSYNEVYDDSYCSKSCRKNTENLNTKISKLNEELSNCETDLYNYKRGLSQVEARLVEFKEHKVKFCEKIRVLERDVEIRDNKIEYLKNELEHVKKDKESLDNKLTGFENASKDLDNLLGSQRSDKNKEGLGYNVVLPPPAQIYSPLKKYLPWTGLPEFVDYTVTGYSRSTPSIDASKCNKSELQSSNFFVFEHGESSGSIMSKPMIKFVKEGDCLRVIKTNNTKNVRKSTVKYAEMYRNISKGKTWPKDNYAYKSMTPRAVLLKPGTTPIVGNPHNNIDDKGYWDSGCSRHMNGNISHLSECKPYDRGYVSFGHGGGNITGKDFKLNDDTNVLLKTTRQPNMYSIDLNNIAPHKNLTCLVAKASIDESMLWHKRLGHLNFKTMNKLVRNNIVKGLPSKSFGNDHTCVACLKGKQHKASCKTKLVNSVFKPLHTLHMDLFGPTSISSLNYKWYCLVVTDDFSRFTWTFFLRTKDETSSILRNFITEIENLKDLKVKIIRNRTLIEAARTLLADAKLPVIFWAEAVNTTCYVQNRVLVNKSQNKTPYELFNCRIPAIGFLRPFGCHVMILNTLDHLEKFDAKEDEGYFVGYSLSSKAFRVFNKRTKKVEENLHVDFLENKLIEKGSGPNWLFDIDTLTNLMNYLPVVVAGTSSTNISAHMEASNDTIRNSDAQDDSQEEQDCNADVPESSGISNPTATSKVPSADQVERAVSLTVESKIPTVSSQVPTVCLDISPESSSGPRLITKGDFSQLEAPFLGNALTLSNRFEDTFGVEVVLSNMETSIPEERIDYEDVFAPVARIEAIRLFLAYASFMGFKIYQMDVKSAFLYGTIDEELYREFEALMHDKFQISDMGELTFFLRLQVLQKKDGIFLSQDKYVCGILKKFGYSDVRSANTPINKENPWGKMDLGEGSANPTEPHHTPSPQEHHSPQHDSLPPSPHTIIFEPLPQALTKTLTPRRLTRRVIWIAQSKALLPVADEPASLLRDNRQGEAFPTVSSLDAGQDMENIAKTSALPHESSPRVTSLDANEGSMQQRIHELMELCTSLQRQQSHMAAKIKDQDLEISGLKARVKSFKDKERRHAEPTQEDAPITGGIKDIGEELGADKSNELGTNDTKEMINVLTLMEAANILSSGGATASVSPADVFPSAGVPAVSAIFTTASVVAREMEEEFSRENQRLSEQLARDFKITIIHAEEELKIMIEGRDRSNEVIAKHLSEYEQIEADLSIGEKIELISELLVPLEEVYIEALQVKHTIIDWEMHSEGKREYWKIIRLGGHTAVYQFFVDMLKQFDREDLHQL